MIEIVEFAPEGSGHWKAFLQSSNNGTLFHDLDFLGYHAAEKFATRHLIFRQGGEIVGLLPAAVVTEATGLRILKSPYGASIGGFVQPRRLATADALALVASLKDFVAQSGFDGTELRIGPGVFSREPDEQQQFALAAHGFQLMRRWLTLAIPLANNPDVALQALPKRRAEYYRAAERKGITLKESGPERLEEFYGMLCRDRETFGAKPTHTLEELRRLYERVPHALRLFLAFVSDQMVAGALVFELNDVVAYDFYPCHDAAFDSYRPALFLAVNVARYYATHGFRFLDLGPVTFDDYSLNRGLASFKESLGARGYCRDTWRWDR